MESAKLEEKENVLLVSKSEKKKLNLGQSRSIWLPKVLITHSVGAFMHADGPTKTVVSEERSLLLS